MKKYKLIFLIAALVSALAYADDTEIYLGNPDSNTAKPNVLFIFDTSGSMGESHTYCDEYGTKTTRECAEYGGWWGTTCQKWEDVVEEGVCLTYKAETRLAITQKAAKNTINNLSGVNLGLMQFNIHDRSGLMDTDRARGGIVDVAIGSLDDATHKNNIISKINSYQATTWTPLVKTVEEALRYMRGDEVKYAKKAECTQYSGSGYNRVCTRYSDTIVSISDSYSGNSYISPMVDQCQKNHIVLFTDGASTRDSGSDTYVQNLMKSNFSLDELEKNGLNYSCKTNENNAEGSHWSTSCLKDLAYYMNNVDLKPDLDGKQNITFHAVGGFIGGNLQTSLDIAAKLGGGVSANAQNPKELEAALLKVFDNIVQSGGTFAAPAVAVNAFNSLEHLDQMYYSLFKPHAAVGWAGNVKRYRMKGTEIVDVDDKAAVDSETGFFKDDAKSFWSPEVDGDNVTAGGMASKLKAPRKVVTNLVSNNLMDSDNLITSANSKLTRGIMGTMLRDESFAGSDVDPDDVGASNTEDYNTAEFSKLLNWVGGYQANATADEPRYSMEDPLHSTPALVNYGSLEIDGKKVPDSTLFVGTNSGYLHAFDTNEENPQERFAFIPRELLPVATKYYEGVGTKKYGLDGPITIWHNDTNKNMLVDNNEQAILYIGMRRGGSSYYALDISNRDNPRLLWQINGKGHQNGATAGFEELGQTWSKLIPIDIKWQGAKKKALVFAGGYDIQEDDNLTRQAHNVGNAIFIIDAETGALLWKASKNTGHLKLSNMTSAITGNVVAIDDSGDGYVDLLYVADLGGRIWRFDVNRDVADSASGNASNYMSGGMIADLGKNSSQQEHVRFYDGLDVAYTREFAYVEDTGNQQTQIQKPRYMLSIGSGYRAHPLDNSARDHFYVLFDYNTEGPARDNAGKPVYTAKTKQDLQSYSFSAVSGAESGMQPTVKSNNGFYFKLISAEAGEKVLSSSITVNNTIYFTSFRPSTGASANSCVADTGNSRLYRVSLKFNGSVVKQDEITVPGIAPTPIPKTVDIEDCSEGACDQGKKKTVLIVGTKVIDDLDDPEFNLKKTYWKELSN